MIRLDRRGRRIGRNVWRETCVETWRAAYDAWTLELEAASNGWATEAAEFRASSPCPTFKSTLIGLAS